MLKSDKLPCKDSCAPAELRLISYEREDANQGAPMPSSMTDEEADNCLLPCLPKDNNNLIYPGAHLMTWKTCRR